MAQKKIQNKLCVRNIIMKKKTCYLLLEVNISPCANTCAGGGGGGGGREGHCQRGFLHLRVDEGRLGNFRTVILFLELVGVKRINNF